MYILIFHVYIYMYYMILYHDMACNMIRLENMIYSIVDFHCCGSKISCLTFRVVDNTILSHFHVKWSFQIKLVFSCGGAGRAKKNKHNLLSNIQTYRETGALNRCFALSWPSVARVTLERNACHDQQ